MSLTDRIQQRLVALNKTARAASIEAGLGENFIRDVFNGKSREPSASALGKLARVLETTPTYLLEGLAEAAGQPIPLVNYIGAGAAVMPIEDQGPLEYVEAPPGAVGVQGAAIVRGSSQMPALREGDVVFWGDGSNDPAAYLGLECICSLMDGRVLVKTIIGGSRPGYFTLLSHNADPILDVAITSAAPVLWVKRSLQR